MSQLPDNRVSRSANAEDGGSLQKIQTLLEETQQLTKVGGWEFDIANGQLTWTNEVYRIYGVDPETYNPNDIDRDITFYDPKDQAVIIAAFHRAVEHGHSYDLELCFPDDDGIEKWVRTIGVAEEIDGRVTRVFGNIMDITERKRAEEELRRTYAFTQDILDTAQTIILVLDAEGRIESFNPYMEKISGYCLAEVRGKEWIPTFLPERDHARLRGILQEALGDVLISGNVNAIVTKTGEERLIEWHCRTLKSASNQTTGVLSIGQDVTDRAKSESEIHDTKHFLDTVVDMSPFPMWVSDPEGIVIRTNRALRETLGLTDKDIVGQYNVLKDTNLEVQGVMPLVRDVFEKCEPAHFSIPWHAADAGHVAFAGGRDPYIDVSMFPILDAAGTLLNVVCQWTDITELKRAEEAVKRERIVANTIIDSIPGVFYVLDENGRYVRWNAYYREEIVGKPDALIAGTNAIETVHPDDRQFIQARIANVLENGAVENAEARILVRGGPAFRWMVMTALRMVIDGSPYLVGIGIDITQRKLAEQQMEEQLEELRRWHEVTLGRETRVIELKSEVNELLTKAGQPPRYGDMAEEEAIDGS